MNFEPRVPKDDVNVTPRHPLKEAGVLVVGVVLLTTLALGMTTLLIDRICPLLPMSWEATLFPDFGAMQHTPETETEKAQQALLESLLARLTAHWPERPPGLRIGLLDASQPNALAFPGGLILLTTGLMSSVESENELAFVLGHELGHYRNRDHVRQLGRGLALGLVLAALGQSGTTAELIGFSGQLTQRSFSRDQESAADSFGLSLVEMEFGHVGGATDFFARLPEPETALERSLASYLATHPLSDDRVEAMTRLALDEEWPSEGETTPIGAAADRDARTKAPPER